MAFTEAVKAELERRGMPIATLARRSEVSRQTIYTLLAGETVSAAVRERIARVLELPCSHDDAAAPTKAAV